MQIYKIYEMETKILSNLKTYKNNKNPNDYEKKEINNNPEFDDIKVFSDEIIRN